MHELATKIDEYTISDLKNHCITIAYRAARELLKRESKKGKAKNKNT